ncbi:hypothetical protein D3C84_575320 [compost metagenome]
MFPNQIPHRMVTFSGPRLQHLEMLTLQQHPIEPKPSFAQILKPSPGSSERTAPTPT